MDDLDDFDDEDSFEDDIEGDFEDPRSVVSDASLDFVPSKFLLEKARLKMAKRPERLGFTPRPEIVLRQLSEE